MMSWSVIFLSRFAVSKKRERSPSPGKGAQEDIPTNIEVEMNPEDFVRRNPGRAGRKATPKPRTTVKKRSKKTDGGDGEGTAAKPKRNNALTKPIMVNEELAKILGVETVMPRTQVVKALVEHIKANKLQDPKDGRKIRFSEPLEKLFGRKTTTFFKLQKLLGERKLVYKPDEVYGDDDGGDEEEEEEEAGGEEEQQEGEGKSPSPDDSKAGAEALQGLAQAADAQ